MWTVSLVKSNHLSGKAARPGPALANYVPLWQLRRELRRQVGRNADLCFSDRVAATFLFRLGSNLCCPRSILTAHRVLHSTSDAMLLCSSAPRGNSSGNSSSSQEPALQFPPNPADVTLGAAPLAPSHIPRPNIPNIDRLPSRPSEWAGRQGRQGGLQRKPQQQLQDAIMALTWIAV